MAVCSTGSISPSLPIRNRWKSWAHAVLRRIASGEIASRQLPETAALPARHEDGAATAAPAATLVFHLPGIRQTGSQSAA